MVLKVELELLINFAEEAGRRVMTVYHQNSFEIRTKTDQSPLTQADLNSELYLSEALKKYYPAIPILSEESLELEDYEFRKNWKRFFLVDPLDGTKEFVQSKPEFTINLALIEQERPVLGVIHAPSTGVTYYAEKNKGAFKKFENKIQPLPLNQKEKQKIRVTYSRSQPCEQTRAFLKRLKEENEAEIIELPCGSALKFGLVAEGLADLYPRFSPSMEWDTAAGQILVNEAGKRMLDSECGLPLGYNKPNLLNPGFIVC